MNETGGKGAAAAANGRKRQTRAGRKAGIGKTKERSAEVILIRFEEQIHIGVSRHPQKFFPHVALA